jgi:hypothetical protein
MDGGGLDGGGGIDGGGMDGGGGIDGGGGSDGGSMDGGSDSGTCSSNNPPTGSGQTEAQLPANAQYLGQITHQNGISGGTAAIGTQGIRRSKGKVTVYAWDCATSAWAEEGFVSGSDTLEEDLFGSSLSLAGSSLVVGANYKDTGVSSSGVAYAFSRSGTTWSQLQKISAPGGAGQRFGWAIAQTSTTLAISSPLGKDPSSLVTYTGAVGIYTKGMNGLWANRTLLVPSTAAKDDAFGASLAMDGNNLVGGAPGAYIWGVNTGVPGKVWVFTGSVATWTEAPALVASDGANEDWFGRSVAIRHLASSARRRHSRRATTQARRTCFCARAGRDADAKLWRRRRDRRELAAVAAVGDARAVGAPGKTRVHLLRRDVDRTRSTVPVRRDCVQPRLRGLISGKRRGTVFDLSIRTTRGPP